MPMGERATTDRWPGSGSTHPIAHIVSTSDGQGYWLVAGDGGIFSFGDAAFFGSMGGRPLNAPVVDMAPTADGRGYWLVASDGGIFSFGDAAFHGSMGGQRLNQPVVAVTDDVQTGGYWEAASDGGIFAFDAPFLGSTGCLHLNRPVVSMAATASGSGYWFVASDGGIFAFGAPFLGSGGGEAIPAPDRRHGRRPGHRRLLDGGRQRIGVQLRGPVLRRGLNGQRPHGLDQPAELVLGVVVVRGGPDHRGRDREPTCRGGPTAPR